MNTSKTRPPLWETVVIFAAFLGLCAWYFGRQNAFHAGMQPSPLWHLIPLVTGVLLLLVLVRRAQRTTRALREAQSAQRRNWN